jgi:hypothetical protein
MTPVYEHRQVAWPTVIAVLASTLLLALGIVVASRNSLDHLGLLALIPAISVVVLAFFGSMTVRVFSDRVRIHFGIGAPWFTIDLREARGYSVVRNPWFYGWGIHLIPGGVIYNASGFDAVELRMDDGRRIRIGTNEPHALVSALAQVIAP